MPTHSSEIVVPGERFLVPRGEGEPGAALQLMLLGPEIPGREQALVLFQGFSPDQTTRVLRHLAARHGSPLWGGTSDDGSLLLRIRFAPAHLESTRGAALVEACRQAGLVWLQEESDRLVLRSPPGQRLTTNALAAAYRRLGLDAEPGPALQMAEAGPGAAWRQLLQAAKDLGVGQSESGGFGGHGVVHSVETDVSV